MDNIRAQAVLDLINTTNTRNNIEDDIGYISDSDILTSDYSHYFIFDDYDIKKFNIDTSTYGARIIVSFLYIYSEAFDNESNSQQRVFITEKLWTIVKNSKPNSDEKEAIRAAVKLDKLLSCNTKYYLEILYECAEYDKADMWISNFNPVVILVIALALSTGQYIEAMYDVAQKNLDNEDEEQVKAVKLLKNWRCI